jgi:RNA polymerase sigma factor (sigma-70 family)
MDRERLENPDIARIFRGETISGLSEWQLLERYLERRDELAFEALVTRHGPMVLGVCRRMLADESDVEDAFQATFVVFVRRARSLGPRDAIGAWLHGVAARVCLRARSQAARRHRLKPMLAELPSAARTGLSADRELAEVIDQELCRLPSKYREPLVLCYLEGQTHEEAARQLRWPVGTVKGRLARARGLLRPRLTRRGFAPAVGTLTALLTADAAACRRELLERTVKSALDLARGEGAVGAASAAATSLAEGVLRYMLINKLKWAGVAVLVSGLALCGARVIARQNVGPRQNDPRVVRKPPADAAASSVTRSDASSLEGRSTSSLDAKDSPGTVERLLRQYIRAARLEWQTALKEYTDTGTGLDRAYLASRRLMDAEASAAPADARADATQSHFDRMRALAQFQVNNSVGTELEAAQIGVYAAEAELWLADAKTSRPESPRGVIERNNTPPEDATRSGPAGPQSAAGPGNNSGKDPQSRRILGKLDEPIHMRFLEETPLDEVLKHIREATKSAEFPKGIPIYVDPFGLDKADKTLQSTVRDIDLDGVPLRRTLQLALAQLEMVYLVDDGMLYITSATSADEALRLEPAIPEPSPIVTKIAQAERGELSAAQMKELIEVLKAREAVRKLTRPEEAAGRFGVLRVPPPETADAKRSRELMDLLLTETRALVELLRAQQQAKRPADAK